MSIEKCPRCFGELYYISPSGVAVMKCRTLVDCDGSYDEGYECLKGQILRLKMIGSELHRAVHNGVDNELVEAAKAWEEATK